VQFRPNNNDSNAPYKSIFNTVSTIFEKTKSHDDESTNKYKYKTDHKNNKTDYKTDHKNNKTDYKTDHKNNKSNSWTDSRTHHDKKKDSDRKDRDPERKELERRELDKKYQERKYQERKDQERKYQERKDQERKDQERKDQEKKDQERKDQERRGLERGDRYHERGDHEKRDHGRGDHGRGDQERKDQERRDQERKDQERRDQERRDQERRDQERRDQERRDQERRDERKEELEKELERRRITKVLEKQYIEKELGKRELNQKNMQPQYLNLNLKNNSKEHVVSKTVIYDQQNGKSDIGHEVDNFKKTQITFEKGKNRFYFYNFGGVYLGSFTPYELVKYISEQHDTKLEFMNRIRGDKYNISRQIIKTFLGQNIDDKFVFIDPKLSPFTENIEQLIQMNNLLHDYQNKYYENELKKITCYKTMKKIKSSIDLFIYSMLNYSLKIISHISEIIKTQPNNGKMKKNIVKYSIGTVYRITEYLNKRAEEYFDRLDSLSEIIQLNNEIRLMIGTKMDGLNKKLEGQNQMIKKMWEISYISTSQ